MFDEVRTRKQTVKNRLFGHTLFLDMTGIHYTNNSNSNTITHELVGSATLTPNCRQNKNTN